MPRQPITRPESELSPNRSAKTNVTIVLGFVSLAIGAVIFAFSASVIGPGNAALAVLGLILVGVILIVGELIHRQP